MKVAILGYSTLEQSESVDAYKYFRDKGDDITIFYWENGTEAQDLPAEAKKQLVDKDADFKNLDEFDLIVRGAVIHPRRIHTNKPVTTVNNIFTEICPALTIGITGTKGKGTTSTLTTKMLEASGKTVHLVGNIGRPPLSVLPKITKDDVVVMELSSFQLIDFKRSPRIAVCLMVEPEHLDWHEDFEEYVAAKQQLFIHQTEQDIAIYNSQNENSLSIADASEGKLIPYMEAPGAYITEDSITIDGKEICKTSELKLLGKHNWQNVCAAITATWQITQDIEAIRKVATTFAGLPFRIEFRSEVNGIRFYNDSYGSAPNATIAALESIPGKKVIIIGGFDRMLNLSVLAQTLKQYEADIRKIVLIGASAERTAKNLDEKNFKNYIVSKAGTMPAIVSDAVAVAEKGDAVILSPGFPSFDLFKNFEDRGIKFNEAVANL